MRMPTKQKPSADDVRRVAIAALNAALEDGKQEAKKKPGLTGVRAVATGAVLYTAGRAAFSGRRFIRDHFGSDGEAQDEDFEDEEEDEPRAEEDEDYEDEEDEDEPQAEEDEDYEDEEDEDEPQAEEDEDYDDEDEDDEEQERAASSRRPPSHPKRTSGDESAADLPARPSRSRAPVGLS